MQTQKHYETQRNSCLQGKKTAVNYSHVIHISTRATEQQKDWRNSVRKAVCSLTACRTVCRKVGTGVYLGPIFNSVETLSNACGRTVKEGFFLT